VENRSLRNFQAGEGFSHHGRFGAEVKQSRWRRRIESQGVRAADRSFRSITPGKEAERGPELFLEEVTIPRALLPADPREPTRSG